MTYINKSVRGNSIISNLDIEESININCNITNNSSATFDIGSYENTYRNLYIQDLSISGTSYLNKFTSLAPIKYTNGNISLNIDNNTLFVSAGNLQVRDNLQVTLPLFYTQGNISLNIDSNSLIISQGYLKVRDNLTVNNPLVKTGNNIRLNYNLSQFSNQDNYLRLSYGNPFKFDNNQLELKLKTFQYDNLPVNKIFVNNSGELDLNIGDIVVASSGIRKQFSISDITVLGLDIDLQNLEFKSNKLSIRSLGNQRVSYYNSTGLTSDTAFTYNEVSNLLTVNNIFIGNSTNTNTNLDYAVNKRYVDSLKISTNSGSPLSLNPDYVLSLGINYTLKVVNNILSTTLTPKIGSPISIDPNNDIDLQTNSDLIVIGNQLQLSTLIKTDITTLKTDVGILKTDVGLIKTQVTTLQGQTATLTTGLATTNAALASGLAAASASLAGEVARSTGVDIATGLTLGIIGLDITDLKGGRVAMDNYFTTMTQNVTRIEQTIGSINTNLSSLNLSVININSTTNSLLTSVSSNSLNINQINSTTTSLLSNYIANTNNILNISTNSLLNTLDINTLKTDVCRNNLNIDYNSSATLINTNSILNISTNSLINTNSITNISTNSILNTNRLNTNQINFSTGNITCSNINLMNNNTNSSFLTQVLFGTEESSYNLGRIYYNFLSQDNANNTFEIGTYSSYIQFINDGFKILAQNYTTDCTIQGKVKLYGSLNLDNLLGPVSLTAPLITTGNLISTNVTTSNIVSTNLTTSNIVSTNIVSTNLSTGNLISSNITTQNINLMRSSSGSFLTRFDFGVDESNHNYARIFYNYLGINNPENQFLIGMFNGSLRFKNEGWHLQAQSSSTLCGLQGNIIHNGNFDTSRLNLGVSTNDFNLINIRNDTANGLNIFLNKSNRSADGGNNTGTIRNDAGFLILSNNVGSNININGSNISLNATNTYSQNMYSNILRVGNSNIFNKLLILNDNDGGESLSTGINFFGMGINSFTMRYQVPATCFHRFYIGSSLVATLADTSNFNNLSTSNITTSNLISNNLSTSNITTSNLRTTGLITSNLNVSFNATIGSLKTTSINSESITATSDLVCPNITSQFINSSTHFANGNVSFNTTNAPTNTNFRAYGNPSADFNFGSQRSGTAFVVYNQAGIGAYLVSGNTAWQANSDIRVKKEVSLMKKGLEYITKLKPSYFKYITDKDNDKKRIGFIADDVEIVLPELITKRKESGYEDLKGLSMESMIPFLVNSIKELNDKIIQLELNVKIKN